MIKEIWSFLKRPDYKVDEDTNLKYRFTIFFRLLFIALMISVVLGLCIGLLESAVSLDLGEHAMDLLIDQYSTYFIFFAAVILAPLLEELFFRGPMVFFKKSPHFWLVFYLFTLLFGFYHITNFEITPTVLILSPLLVAPQLCVGVLLGFIRVRFGLLWAILLHACYNLVLLGPIVFMKALDLPLE